MEREKENNPLEDFKAAQDAKVQEDEKKKKEKRQ